MHRTVRLFVYAGAMLAVAVGVATMLRDDSGYEAGRSEISGKLVGLTEYQENRTEAGHLTAQEPSTVERKAETVVGEEKKTPSKEEAAPVVKTQEKKSSAPVAAPKAAALEKSEKEAEAVSKEAAPKVSEPAQAQTEKKSDAVSTARVEPEAKDDEVARKTSEPAQKEESAAAAGSDPLPVVSVSAESRGEGEDPKTSSAAEEKPEASDQKGGATSGGSPVSQALAEVRADMSGEVSAEKSEEKAEKAEPQYERVVTSARFAMQGSQIKLILQGNAPMVGHYFSLENPDRIVLDLAGNWEVQVPKVPSNRLIRAVRVGHHDDKTRIVFDMKTQGKAALVPLDRNALELRIQ